MLLSWAFVFSVHTFMTSVDLIIFILIGLWEEYILNLMRCQYKNVQNAKNFVHFLRAKLFLRRLFIYDCD